MAAAPKRADKVQTYKGALKQAQHRIRSHAGPWTIDFPGSSDEHYTVIRADDDKLIGPDSQGAFEDDPPEDDHDD